MNPASRQQLIDYCLRKLGHPVIEINIDDDQLEDRVDEALQFYREFHYDAVETVYLRTTVDPTVVVINSGGTNFGVGEKIIASTGGEATVHRIVSNTQIEIFKMSGNIIAGATITNESSTATATVTQITKGSFDNQYFELSDAITGINKVLPFTNKSTGINVFDIRYQILINDLYTLQSTDLVYYTQIKNHLELINMLLVGAKPVRFNRHTNRLYVDMSWGIDVVPGDYVIVECQRILDPNQYTDVYNDMMLKRYTTACIKRQWGENLKKFEGVSLPGGVTLNGQKIFDEAMDEIQKLEEEIRLTWEEPVSFIVG
jgi:hypothetical protein